MASKKLSAELLDNILNETIEKVSGSHREIFEIGEQSRAEYNHLTKKLAYIKKKVEEVISEGDKLELRVRRARNRLAEVSKQFNKYGEDEIHRVYKTTNELQVKLSTTRQRESQLREQRDEIERRLRQVKETVIKAEHLTGQISVVLNYLSGDLKQMSEFIDDANRKQAFGLKIIEAQEEERKRLSREIHDGPAQMLANMLLRSELIEKICKEQGTDAAIGELKDLRSLVRDSLREVRHIIYDLRPMALDDLGLIPTLQRYLKTVEENFAIPIEFHTIGKERRLPAKFEVALFRLIQEAVQNACKHAQANEVQVKIEFREQEVTLLVKDDGKGFELGKKRENAFGLIGMNERVDMLEGKLAIHSFPNHGTKILIRIPVREMEVGHETYN